MNSETKPLTAEEIADDAYQEAKDTGWITPDYLEQRILQFAAQQTAALRGQLEAMKKERCEALKLLNHIQSTPQYFMQVHVRERIRRFLERTDDAY